MVKYFIKEQFIWWYVFLISLHLEHIPANAYP